MTSEIMYRGSCTYLQGLNYKTKTADTFVLCSLSFKKGKNSYARLKQWDIQPTILLLYLLTISESRA